MGEVLEGRVCYEFGTRGSIVGAKEIDHEGKSKAFTTEDTEGHEGRNQGA